MIARLSAVTLSLGGVWVFVTLDVPLPWLLGPMAACLIAALFGVPLGAWPAMNTAMRMVLGVALGAAITPSVLGKLTAMWPTLLMVPVMTAAMAAVGVPYFMRVWKFDFATSYYSAMPGGLQDMLLLGKEAGARERTLSIVHATRLLVIVAALPFLLQGVWNADLTGVPGATVQDLSWVQVAVMIVCALVGWRLARAIRLPGAAILGPMLAAGSLAASGLLTAGPPTEAIWAAQFFIGMSIGCKYAGITFAEIRHDVTAALGLCVILGAITLVFVEAVHIFGLAPGKEALLAFAPGGQAEMAILALILGADVAFVVAHHIFRVVCVLLGAPLVAHLLKRWC